MRIWLDMANSPHPVLFRAVAPALEARGHELVVTTRDHGQTRDLTLAVWPAATVVGSESPGSHLSKGAAIAARVAQLRKVVRAADVQVAVSLNSYAQAVASRSLRIPSVTLMDYEYQPANHLSFRLASRVLVPRAFPASRLRRYGAAPTHVSRFDGFKEELYLDTAGDAGPPAFVSSRKTRALFRAAAEGSLYHRGVNTGFSALLAEAGRREDVEALVLPRLKAQAETYASIPGLRVVDRTLDGLAALRACDLFVGSGGTMTREAALLGVRTYTMFAGKLPSVDAELMATGRLHDLRAGGPGAVDWSRRSKSEIAGSRKRLERRAGELRAWLVDVIERAAR